MSFLEYFMVAEPITIFLAAYGTQILFSIAISVALTLVSMALAPKPKRQAERQGRKQVVRSSVEPHAVIYGEDTISGLLSFAETSGANNEFAHLIITLAGIEVESLGDVFFNDKIITASQIDGSGNVTAGPYSGFARIKKHLGGPGQVADADLVSAVANWTSAHVGNGIAYLYIRVKWSNDIFPTGLPNIRCRVKGKKVWDPAADPGNPSVKAWSNNAALCQLDYIMSNFGFNIPVGEIHEASWVTAAATCDEQIPNVLTASIFTAVPATDLIVLVDKQVWNSGGLVQFTTTGTLPAGLSLVTDYYLTELTNGDSWAVATSIGNARAGITIDITDTGTGTHTVTRGSELRYTVNGTFQVDTPPADILQDLLSATLGVMSYQQGQFKGYTAGITASTKSIVDDDFMDTIQIVTRPSRSELFNKVRGTYNKADDNNVRSDFAPISVALALSEDNDVELTTDLPLPYTNSNSMAQRIALIHILKHRQGMIVQLPLKISAFGVAVWDVVDVTNAVLGFSNKEFRVLEWEVREDSSILLTCQEEDTASYTWVADTNEILTDTAPDTNLPDPFDVQAPTGLVVTSGTSSLITKADGTIVSRIYATWTLPTTEFVIAGGRIELEFKRSADSAWRQLPPLQGNATEAYIWDVEDDIDYDVRVRSISSLGVASDTSDPWAQTVEDHTVLGKSEVPSDVKNFTVIQNGNVVVLQWDPIPDIDVSYYEARFARI